MIEEILADDPLEVALIRVESKQNTCNVDADGYEKMLDSCESIEKMMAPKQTKATSRIKPPYARGEPEDYTVPQPIHGHEKRELRSPSHTRTSLSPRRQDGIRKPHAAITLCSIPTSSPPVSSTTHPLYPDLHSISLETLTEIYEMSEEYTQTSFPRKFIPEQAFWKFIASGDFKSRSASQSHIRNHVLRITAKVLSNLLFTKDQTSKVTRGELQMLCAGVEDELKSSAIGIPTAPMTTSPGCVLVQMFVDKKAKVCNETAAFIDIPYLINCQILRDETTYSFLSQDGRNLYCKLPPKITALSDVTNICFIPDAQYLCADPKSSYRDDTMDDVVFVRTDGGNNAYDLAPLDDNSDDATYRRWMVDS
ncbi:hypothetical protein F2Q69_00052335 [Brassica cretica]|uniref:Arabidopsis retrotransposon Orf1 C-terminal domain-containing protein n=1 Tax=Brassica cretica TaxID=69181 RepID=A0A8S9N0Q4_BRACR|nr:hypothetical protein F2Q69_00052335 [Brassica cretica]